MILPGTKKGWWKVTCENPKQWEGEMPSSVGKGWFAIANPTCWVQGES